MGLFDFFRRKSWSHHYQAGMACGAAGQIDAALEHFRQAVRLAPGRPEPHYQLGYTYLLQRDFALALEEYEKTQAIAPGYFIVEIEMDLCRRMLDGSLCLSALTLLQAIQQRIDDGNLTDADGLELCRQAVEQAPSCPLAHYLLGRALAHLDHEAAEQSFRRCLELHPDNTTCIMSRMNLAGLLKEAGKSDEAKAILQSCLREFPEKHPHLALVRLALSIKQTAVNH